VNLLKFRIIGHPVIPDSSWLEVGQGLNVLKTQYNVRAQTLLQMLQTINPPYDFNHVNPFGNFPLYISGQRYFRKIIPSKKTVALAIFAASSQLIEALAALDPILYETGWIEIGRRRDFSRWMNFVELSGSTRWSEIGPIISTLLPLTRAEATPAVDALQAELKTWCGTDRIKGQRAIHLKTQLQNLRSFLPEEHRIRLDSCLQAIDRAQHFSQAKEIVAVRLPIFLSIIGATNVQSAQAAEVDLTSFTFVLTRLREHPIDQAILVNKIQNANLQLATLYPELHLHYRVEGMSVNLENTKNNGPLLFAELSPVKRIEVLMAGLSALHEAIYASQPIFLLDINGMNLRHQERLDLLKVLRRFCSSGQCFVAPEDDFLALCVDVYEEAAKQGGGWLQLIDV